MTIKGKGKGAGKPAPSELEERLFGYDPIEVEAAFRLLSAPVMDGHWNRVGIEAIAEAAHCYGLAVSRDAWSGKTQRERDEWLAKFNKTIEQFASLAEEGPRTPKDWGYPVKDNVLLNLLHLAGYDVPDDPIKRFAKAVELDAIADEVEWTIVDSLLHYQRQIHCDAIVKKPLKKPRDEKAARAEFIVLFRKHGGLSAATVAAVAAAMFQDDAIDERLVRRLTAAQ